MDQVRAVHECMPLRHACRLRRIPNVLTVRPSFLRSVAHANSNLLATQGSGGPKGKGQGFHTSSYKRRTINDELFSHESSLLEPTSRSQQLRDDSAKGRKPFRPSSPPRERTGSGTYDSLFRDSPRFPHYMPEGNSERKKGRGKEPRNFVTRFPKKGGYGIPNVTLSPCACTDAVCLPALRNQK